MQLKLSGINSDIDVRRKNVLSSPKFGGSCDIDSKPYLKELGIEIVERRQSIQFTSNFGEHVHGGPLIFRVFPHHLCNQYLINTKMIINHPLF